MPLNSGSKVYCIKFYHSSPIKICRNGNTFSLVLQTLESLLLVSSSAKNYWPASIHDWIISNKSTMKLTFILKISENVNVFEYVKKNRRLLHRWGMCYPINTFATCNRWEFETKAGLTTKMAIVIFVRLADSVGFEIESVLNAKICFEFQV